MSGPAQDRVPVPFIADELADLTRLRQFRAAHPGVLVGGGDFGTFQALIPEENGETVVVRYTLRELLDKLDALLRDR